MTPLKRLLATLILLTITALAPSAHAGGTALTPNQVAGHWYRSMISHIKSPGVAVSAAEETTLDQYAAALTAFRAWQISVGSWAPHADWRDVYAGASWTVNEVNATWPGPFSTFPVGNQNGLLWPVLECATIPCPIPVWLAGFSGHIIHTTTDPGYIADTSWSTISGATNLYGSTVELSTAHALPCMVRENALSATVDQPRHASGRKVEINHPIVATLSADARNSWFSRCILLALNSGLHYGPASDVTLLHPTEPDIIAGGLPSAIDEAMLAWTWDYLSQTTDGVYPLPDPWSAVP